MSDNPEQPRPRTRRDLRTEKTAAQETAQDLPRINAPLGGIAGGNAAQRRPRPANAKGRRPEDATRRPRNKQSQERPSGDSPRKKAAKKASGGGIMAKASGKGTKLGWKLPLVFGTLMVIGITVASMFAVRAIAPDPWSQQPNDNVNQQVQGAENGTKEGDEGQENAAGKASGDQENAGKAGQETGEGEADPNQTSFTERQYVGAPPPASLVDSKAIPQGASSINRFSTPDKNISCEISAGGVNCIMNEYVFDFGCNVQGHGAVGIIIQGDNGFKPDCYDPTKVDWPTLGAYKSTAHPPFACTVLDSGSVSCWNANTGWGFSMSQQGVQQYMPKG